MNRIETALIVDSDFLMRGYVAESLRNEGIAATEADDESDAFRIMNGTRIDLVFADLKLLKKLEARTRRTILKVEPIWVALTSFGDVDLAIELVKQGVYDYLVKPFTPAQVSIVVLRLNEVFELQSKINALEERMGKTDELPERKEQGRRPGTPRFETANLQVLERETIIRVMEETGGCRNAMAERLGISVRTLRNKLNQYRQEAAI
ncbi:MAG: response regulator [Pontiellaceae bacterium]|nr:response regulator [Pontiellaceae bacterium]